MERRIKIKLEELETVNRYLLNIKREIGTQIRLLKPSTITEAQTHAVEIEMWLKESQTVRHSVPQKVMIKDSRLDQHFDQDQVPIQRLEPQILAFP